MRYYRTLKDFCAADTEEFYRGILASLLERYAGDEPDLFAAGMECLDPDCPCTWQFVFQPGYPHGWVYECVLCGATWRHIDMWGE